MINGNGSTVTRSGGSSRILVLVTDAAVVINDLTMIGTAPAPSEAASSSPR